MEENAEKATAMYTISHAGAKIGRDKSCQIRYDDGDISRIHSEIEYDIYDKCYYLKDCKSANGTFYLVKKSEILIEGDAFQAGSYQFEINEIQQNTSNILTVKMSASHVYKPN